MNGVPGTDRPTILLTHESTAREFWYGQKALAGLRALGEVRLNPDDRIFTPDVLRDAARGCAIIVLDRQTPLTANDFAALPDVVAVLRSGVDARRIDIDAASVHGILVARTAAGYIPPTSELVLAMLLNAARGIPDYVCAYRSGSRKAPQTGRELHGATVGLIGYGRIAKQLAKVLDAIGAKTIAYDPHAAVDAPALGVSLPELLAASDFVVPLVIVSPETTGMLGAAQFAAMKPDAWLVNCSRGEVVDEKALADALDRKLIAGAALDVGRDPDDVPAAVLVRRPDVIATPHIGNLTHESLDRQPLETVAQATAILAGEMPSNAINPESASRFAAFRARMQPA